jgi:hypothetical protein
MASCHNFVACVLKESKDKAKRTGLLCQASSCLGWSDLQMPSATSLSSVNRSVFGFARNQRRPHSKSHPSLSNVRVLVSLSITPYCHGTGKHTGSRSGVVTNVGETGDKEVGVYRIVVECSFIDNIV